MVILKGKSSRVPRALISGALAAALLTANVQAAVLGNVAGPVLVNHGDGFLPASAGSSLVLGDRVRVDNGSADIVYENGCSTRVGPQQVSVVLASPPPCGGGLKDGVVQETAEPSVAPLIIGGLLVGGAVGLAVALSSSGGNNQIAVSP